MAKDIHRIGPATVENFRMNEREVVLDPPGISVLRCDSPDEAARQMKKAFRRSKWVQQLADFASSASESDIRESGFELIADPTSRFRNHYRIVHPDGIDGFVDENLERLVEAFEESDLRG
jgi:hypothetical protein